MIYPNTISLKTQNVMFLLGHMDRGIVLHVIGPVTFSLKRISVGL